MVPALQSKCTQRTQRELKVKTTLLDLLAESKGTEAADVLAQRVKALEKSARDNKQWRWAKHLDLELVEGDDTALVDQGEEDMMAKEAEREEKVKRGAGQTVSLGRKDKGKGVAGQDPRRKGGKPERKGEEGIPC